MDDAVCGDSHLLHLLPQGVNLSLLSGCVLVEVHLGDYWGRFTKVYPFHSWATKTHVAYCCHRSYVPFSPSVRWGTNPIKFFYRGFSPCSPPHRIHGAAIYGNMDPINIPLLCWYIYQHHGSVMGTILCDQHPTFRSTHGFPVSDDLASRESIPARSNISFHQSVKVGTSEQWNWLEWLLHKIIYLN